MHPHDHNHDIDLGAFAASQTRFTQILGFLDNNAAAALTHAELADQLTVRGRELFRELFQDHLDLRAAREQRCTDIVDVTGAGRGNIETGHRQLATVFGEVTVARLVYRRRGHANLSPADARLNLPAEKHSHGLRHLAAIEASRGSFDDTVDAIARATGQSIGKRQVEQLAARTAADFDDFYTHRSVAAAGLGDVVVLSADGKGIVMRHDALRAATAKAATESNSKLTTRLSKGEKANRKRMATVGTVYTAAPAPRSPADIISPAGGDHDRAPGPVAAGKWLTASVVDDAATVIASVFDEAARRDPDHIRPWVALVDGNTHQIVRIRTEADDRDVTVTIVIDFVHVLEYLWSASWSFHDEGDPAAEAWVADKAAKVLAGHARQVAAGIRRRATRNGLDPPRRRNAENAARYLTRNADLLDYPTALAAGWPIATGVIEGACRHLVKDRMDITGARWGLEGAEAILQLRALRANGDLNDYWTFHLDREHQRVHRTRYADNVIPTAA